MQTEYIAKIGGDVSGLLKAIAKAQGEVDKISENEIKIKFNYDGNYGQYREMINKISKEHPELTVQFEYELNKQALEHEKKKLESMLNSGIDLDIGNIQKELSKLTETYKQVSIYSEKAFNSDDDIALQKVEELFTNLAQAVLNYKTVLADMGEDGRKVWNSLDKEMIENLKVYEELSNLKPQSLIPTISDEDIKKQRDVISDIENTLSLLKEKGAKDLGLGSGITDYQEDIDKLNKKIQDLTEEIDNLWANVGGGGGVSYYTFDQLEDRVNRINERLEDTVSKIEDIKKYSVGDTLSKWSDEGLYGGEHFSPMNSSTGETYADFVGAEDYITKKLFDQVIKSAKFVVDSFIHSHPENTAAPSPEDLESWFNLYSEGITKQLIASLKEVFTLDLSKVNTGESENIVNRVRESYDEIDESLKNSIFYKVEDIQKLTSYIFNSVSSATDNSDFHNIIDSVQACHNKILDSLGESINVDQYLDTIDKAIDSTYRNSDVIQNGESKFREAMAFILGDLGDSLADAITNPVSRIAQEKYQEVIKDVFTDPKFLKSGETSAIKIEALTDFIDFNSVKTAAEDAAKNAEKALKDAQDSNSPSKVAEKLGKDFGDGYTKGIESSEDEVRKASENLANTAENGLRFEESTLSKISDDLHNIAIALGAVDESSGLKNFLQQLDDVLVKLDEIAKKAGSGIINLNYDGTTESMKKADAAIEQRWSKEYQGYMKTYDRFMDSIKDKGFDQDAIVSRIFSQYFSDQSFDDVKALFDKSAILKIGDPKEQVRRLTELFKFLRQIASETVDESDQLAEAIRDVFERSSSKRNTNFASIEKRFNKIREVDSENPIADALKDKEMNDTSAPERIATLQSIQELLEKIGQTLTEISQKDFLGENLEKWQNSVEDLVSKFGKLIEIQSKSTSSPMVETIDSAEKTSEAAEKAAEAIKLEGSEAEKAASKKTEFAKANKQVSESALETATSTQKAASGIKKENDAAKEQLKTYNELRKASAQKRANKESEDTKAVNRLLDKQKETYQNIWKIRESIEKLDPERDNNQIKALEKQKRLQQQIFIDTKKELSAFEEKVDNARVFNELIKISSKYQSQISLRDSKEKDSIIGSLGGWKKTLENLKESKNLTDEFQNSVNALLADIKNLSDSADSMDLSKLKKQASLISEAVDRVKFRSKNKSNIETTEKQISKLEARLAKFGNKNTAMNAGFKRDLDDLLERLRKVDNQVDFDNIVSEFNRLEAAVNEAGQTGLSMWDKFTKRLTSMSMSALARYFSFYDIIRYARQATETIRDLDTQLIDLRKTTAMTGQELNEFYYDANNVAKQMGVTTSEIIQQAAAWSRLGYNTKEASESMAALSSQFAQISPGMDVEKATDGLVSTMKAFHVDVADVENEVMDKVNIIGNTMATTNEEVVDMLTRSSAAMAAANNSLQETIALESAAVQITRNAEQTGTAFRTNYCPCVQQCA